ncbi:hypothetical protein [Allosalinactinospora lopnorensis]|uniref:hypothetical protein n=1 Tax=Allosalinactinospora lopnorensis TaxID=1352348 RepID=UPI000623CB28|nr:hypothetical protein [Allosalinactinospora lopnorensis]
MQLNEVTEETVSALRRVTAAGAIAAFATFGVAACDDAPPAEEETGEEAPEDGLEEEGGLEEGVDEEELGEETPEEEE